MPLSQELLAELYAALESVDAVLAKVPDDNDAWNKVAGIQADITNAQERVSELMEGK